MVAFSNLRQSASLSSNTYICIMIYVLKYHDTILIFCIEYKIFVILYLPPPIPLIQ